MQEYLQTKNMVKITQSLIGEGPEIAHIDLVIGPKGGAVESAFMTSLATPSQGHTPLLAVLNQMLLQSLQL